MCRVLVHPDKHRGCPEYVAIAQAVGHALDVLTGDDCTEEGRATLKQVVKVENAAWKIYVKQYLV